MKTTYTCEQCGDVFDSAQEAREHENKCRTTYDVKEIQLHRNYANNAYSYRFDVSLKKWSRLLSKPKEEIRGEIGDYWAFTVDMSEEMEKSLKQRLLKAALNDGEAAITRLQQFQRSAKELEKELK